MHAFIGYFIGAIMGGSSCYLSNRSLSSIINFMNPKEVWYRKPTDNFGLQIFGCPTYARVNNGKLEPGSR